MGSALLETIAIIGAGMMTGNELCVSIVNASLRRQDEHTQFTSGRAFAALFGAFMPFWYAATLLLAGAVAFSLRASGTAAILADVSALLWLLSIIYTVSALVPINNRIAAWEWDARPVDWLQARQKWDALHSARVVLLVVALACLVVACLLARA